MMHRTLLALGTALLVHQGACLAQAPAVSDVPEDWLAITPTSSVDAASIHRASAQVLAIYVRDGYGTGKIPSVPASKKVFVDCAQRQWGYSVSPLQPVNRDFEYQAKLYDTVCALGNKARESDSRPLHSINTTATIDNKDFPLALRKLRYDVERGDAEAPYRLFLFYNEGKVVDKDPVEAGRWLRLAAERGIAQARFRLGNNLLEGNDGFAKNVPEAFKWLLLSAEQGDGNGSYFVGHLYQYGLGVARDLDLSEKYFKEADARGHSGAKKRLAELQALRDSRR
jgi:hypothetical protein